MASMQQQLDAMLARSLAETEGTTEEATADKSSADRAPAEVFMDANITNDQNNKSSKIPVTYADVVKAIGQAVGDCTRRKRNIIISGISECDSIEDIDVVTDLLGTVLRMDTK